MEENLLPIKNKLNFKTFFKVAGSSILISMACLDPGNLKGDMQIAYDMKYKSFWILLLAHIILYFFQESSLILGTVTQKELSKCTTYLYPKKIVIILWVFMEWAIMAADFQEIIGATIAVNLLFNLNNSYVSLLIIIVLSILILFVQEYSQNIFESIFFLFLSIMAFMFIYNFFLSEVNYGEFFKGFIPEITNTNQIYSCIGVIGAIIMPQNLFLQSGLVNKRKELNCTRNVKIKIFKIETVIILIISFLINLFFTATFVPFNDKNLDLKNAHLALEDKLSQVGKIFWILGLFSSGLSSTISGALTGQFILEGYLDLKISVKIRTIISRLITVIPCFIFYCIFQDSSALITICNIVQFLSLPFALIPLIKSFTNKKLMKNYVISKFKIYLLIIFTILLQLFNMILIFQTWDSFNLVGLIILFIFITLYYAFVFFLIFYKNQ